MAQMREMKKKKVTVTVFFFFFTVGSLAVMSCCRTLGTGVLQHSLAPMELCEFLLSLFNGNQNK